MMHFHENDIWDALLLENNCLSIFILTYTIVHSMNRIHTQILLKTKLSKKKFILPHSILFESKTFDNILKNEIFIQILNYWKNYSKNHLSEGLFTLPCKKIRTIYLLIFHVVKMDKMKFEIVYFCIKKRLKFSKNFSLMS